MSYRRALQIFFLLVAIGLIVASVAGVPLTWDGAFYFFYTLDTGRPYIIHGRTINLLLELPLLAASRFTENLAPLRVIFSLSYGSLPIAGLAVSWLICRDKRPSLFIWPALSGCVAMLPGQAAFSSEAIMTAWLLWPVFLAALIGVRRTYLPFLAALAIAAFVAHPISAAFFGFSAVVAAIASLILPDLGRERMMGALVLALIAVARLLVPLSEYESARLSSAMLLESYQIAVAGLPATALVFSLVAAACLLLAISGWLGPAKSSMVNYAASALILGAGVLLVGWAMDGRRWAWALAYRFWTSPISLTFMAAAAAEVLLFRSRPAEEEPIRQHGRIPALLVIGAIFLAVLSIQSFVWAKLTDRLERTVQQSPSGCIPRLELFWTRRTPLDHWGTGSYAIDIQGRKPKTLVLDRNDCREFAASGEMHLSKQYVRGRQGGWFDFSDVPATVLSWAQLKPSPHP
ncbi:MAG TPA: hypothetical protein VMB26_14780 [Candidatus Binataceae bacterium]|nr:hypothetical protein [Candidatus Binataceae bacterium]